MLEGVRALDAAAGRATPTAANFFAQLWCFAQETVLDFRASLPPAQSARVRGEDLLSSPDEHLATLAAWLGVRADEAAVSQMKQPERWPYADGSVGGEGDPKFFADPRLRPASGWPPEPFPPGWKLEPALAQTLLRLAARLGYD